MTSEIFYTVMAFAVGILFAVVGFRALFMREWFIASACLALVSIAIRRLFDLPIEATTILVTYGGLGIAYITNRDLNLLSLSRKKRKEEYDKNKAL